MRISAVVLTKNEEKNIERCLKSVSFCDEIIVVDDFSVDKTLQKIRNKYKILVFKRKLNGDFASQRNYGIEKAKNEWILFVDADEEVSDELQREIQYVIHHKSQFPISNISAFYIKRRDYFWEKELKWGEIRKIRQIGLIRLIRKKTGKWVGKVHEEFKINSEKVLSAGRRVKVKRLKSYLNHYPHPTIKEFLKEINFYSTLRAKELFSQKNKTNILEIIFYPFGKFFLTYFVKLGFLDGVEGFVYAFFMSFHSFLVRAKLF